MSELAKKKCVPCEGDVEPFNSDQIAQYIGQIDPAWQVADDSKAISRDFKFKNYAKALEFVNDISKIAESEGHHPDITFGWGYVKVKLFTHAIKGLSENDFILAAKIDKLKL